MDKLLKELKTNGGFTKTKKLNSIKTKSGYCVSVTSNIVSEDKVIPTIKKLQKDKGKFYIGAWVDGESIYIDKTLIIKDYKKALKVAKKYNQKAIYNLNNNQSIYLEEVNDGVDK